jgi:AraC-like DNA-binding protein
LEGYVAPGLAGNAGIVQVSTAAMATNERLPRWREEFGRAFLHIDFEPLDEAPFEGEATMCSLPGMRALSARMSAAKMVRTKAMITAGDDHFGFAFNINSGPALLKQRGKDLELRSGDAVSISHLDPADLVYPGGRHIGLVFPIRALEPLVGDVEAKAARRVRRENPALRLLKQYLSAVLREDHLLQPAELRHLAAGHIRDLVAMAIGATEEGADAARKRGMRAARLHGIKAEILDCLGSPGLSVALVAQRQHLTPRHVHRLFVEEGTTFSQFVLGERLASARRMLTNPAYGFQTVTAIAYGCGFGDLSYFNRSFRRRYGATPSEVRTRHASPSAENPP